MSTVAPEARALALVQWLAIGSMLVDHLGALAYLGDWSRLVGRLALPLFVLMVAHNAQRATDPGAMFVRVVLLLIVSQPIWSVTVGDWQRLCILLTLAAVVALVWAWRVARWDALFAVLGGFLLLSPFVEYGPWPLLLVPLAVRPSPWTLLLALTWPLLQYWHPAYTLAALVPVLVVVALVRFPFNVPRAPRGVSRWFYPGHLFVLFIIKMM